MPKRKRRDTTGEDAAVVSSSIIDLLVAKRTRKHSNSTGISIIGSRKGTGLDVRVAAGIRTTTDGTAVEEQDAQEDDQDDDQKLCMDTCAGSVLDVRVAAGIRTTTDGTTVEQQDGQEDDQDDDQKVCMDTCATERQKPSVASTTTAEEYWNNWKNASALIIVALKALSKTPASFKQDILKLVKDIRAILFQIPYVPEDVSGEVLSSLDTAEKEVLLLNPVPTNIADTTNSTTIQTIDNGDGRTGVGEGNNGCYNEKEDTEEDTKEDTKQATNDIRMGLDTISSAGDKNFPPAVQSPQNTLGTVLGTATTMSATASSVVGADFPVFAACEGPDTALREEIAAQRARLAAQRARLAAQRARLAAQRARLAEQYLEIAAKDQEISAAVAEKHTTGAAQLLQNHLSSVVAAVTLTQEQLNRLYCLHQGDNTVGSLGTTARYVIEEFPEILHRDANAAPGDILPAKASMRRMIDPLLEGAVSDLDGMVLNLDCVTKDDLCKLEETSNFFQNFIASQETKIVPHDCTDIEKKQSKIDVRASISRLEDALFKSPWNPIAAVEDGFFPGAVSNEVDGAQPMFSLMLRAVSMCLPQEVPNSVPKSPSKSRSRRELIVPATDDRCKRVVDFVVEKDERFYFLLQDYVMELVGEAKPGCRLKIGPQEILAEARNQGLSHVAKYVMMGLNFASGAGTNTHGTFFIANLALIQVFRLELTGVGTKDVKLTLRHSRMLPLMTKCNFCKWAKSAGSLHEKEFKELEQEMYKENDGMRDNIPLGFICLFNLMLKQRTDLFGPTDPFVGTDVGGLIGRGSIADVYAYKEAIQTSALGCSEVETYVLKMSRYGASAEIQNEAAILSKLNHADSTMKNVPTLFKSFDAFSVSLGKLKASMPAIALSPRGVAAKTACIFDCPGLLNTIFHDTMAALKFIHKNNVVHNDVSPKNIIVVKLSLEKQRAVLIDFSIATDVTKNQELMGFQGTVNFAHEKVFEYYPSSLWKSKPEYDFAGLGYTMAALVNNGNLPYPPIAGFPKKLNPEKKSKLNDALKIRYDRCLKLLVAKKKEKSIDNNLARELTKHLKEYCQPCASRAK